MTLPIEQSVQPRRRQFRSPRRRGDRCLCSDAELGSEVGERLRWQRTGHDRDRTALARPCEMLKGGCQLEHERIVLIAGQQASREPECRSKVALQRVRLREVIEAVADDDRDGDLVRVRDDRGEPGEALLRQSEGRKRGEVGAIQSQFVADRPRPAPIFGSPGNAPNMHLVGCWNADIDDGVVAGCQRGPQARVQAPNRPANSTRRSGGIAVRSGRIRRCGTSLICVASTSNPAKCLGCWSVDR